MDTLTSFPQQLRTRESQRIRNFLQLVECSILPHVHLPPFQENKLRIVVYGSCAVSLYLADDDLPVAMTEDIDISANSSRVPFEQYAPSVEPPLVFQRSQAQNWLIHPDWEGRIFNVSSFLGLSLLEVWLLHPMDLILTKLQRYHPRDQEDCIRLNQRYICDFDVFRQNMEEALDYLAGEFPHVLKGMKSRVFLDLYDRDVET